MTSQKSLLIFSIFLAALLTGCMSLAEDITPPPGAEAPSLTQNTPAPEPTSVTSLSGLQTPANMPDPNFGALTYVEKCAPCHGQTGLGDGPDAAMLENPVPALGTIELARAATPSDWYTIVTLGNMQNFMPPFSSLSDQQRWDVVAYALSLGTSAEELAQGQALYIENCAECHGADGTQGGVDFTEAAWMSATSTADMFAAITTGGAEMPAFNELDEAERWLLAGYVRSLGFLPFTMVSEALAPEAETETETEETQPETAIPIDGEGTIQVSVVNMGGGELPQNLEVVLRGYDQMTEVFTRTQTVSAEAIASFDAIPLPAGRMYFATIEHANAAYGSDVIEISPELAALELEIQYYAPSTDPGILNVERLHLFIDFIDEQTLEVFQLYIFSNPTDQILAPETEDGVAVNFVIPADAANLSVEENMSLALRRTADGFGIINVYPDTNPYQVVFSYQVDYDGKLDLSVPIGMDANAVIVMTPSDGFKLKSEQLVDAGTRDFQGVVYNMYNGSNLKSGTPLEMNLSGMPNAGISLFTNVENSTTGLVIGLAGFGSILIGAGIYLWRRNASDDDFDTDELETDECYETSDEVMDAIIALDDLYKKGELPEPAYQERRAELKKRLKDFIEST